MRQKVVISKATIDRLPLYFRTLRVTKEEGREIISSEELGRRLGITPEQIRKDLASFGQFGKKGVGYYVHELMRNIGEILGLDNNWNIAVVGIGHLGAALANYQNFITLGFNLMALFDADEDVVGTIVNKVKVDHINDVNQVVKERNIHIGVIAVPAPFAQEVADKLVTAGVTGIWNFAPRKIVVPEHICIVNEDLSVGLSNLAS